MDHSKRYLFLLLMLAFAVRLALIVTGGQFYVPDEARFQRSWQLLEDRDFSALLSYHGHPGFVIAGLIPASVQKLSALILQRPPDNLNTISAIVLSAMTLGCIGIVYFIALRLRASPREALMAAFLMAVSNSMFYWSRHLMPYDTSMFVALLALYVGISPKSSIRRSLLVGFLACCAFLIYSGYWLLAICAVIIHLVQTRRRIHSTLAAISGLAILPALLTLLTLGMSTPFLRGMAEFGSQVTQGWFSEGWSLPFEYFWASERLILIVWLIGIALVLVHYRQNRHRRVLLWLLCLAIIYGGLVTGSVILERFVVYGRLARQMIPFVCLLAAYGFMYLTPQLRKVAVAAALIVAIPNFIAPFGISFPRDLEVRMSEEVGTFRRDMTLEGTSWEPNGEGRYILVNTQFPYPITGIKPVPEGEVLLRLPHPYQFEPFLYEGLDPEMRAIVRSTEVYIMLIDSTPDEN